MATEFQIFISGTSETKAHTCAAEALRDLELLEAELSRFRDGSDISRLNHLPPGKSTPIGEAAYDCINLAKEIHLATNGAFDITIGSFILHLRHCFSNALLPFNLNPVHRIL